MTGNYIVDAHNKDIQNIRFSLKNIKYMLEPLPQ